MSRFSDSPNEDEIDNILESMARNGSRRRSIFSLRRSSFRESESVDANAMKRDRDKMQIMQSKLVPTLSQEDRGTAREIVKSVDELLGLSIKLEESDQGPSRRSPKQSPTGQKIKEEVVSGVSKQKAPIDITSSTRSKMDTERQTPQKGARESPGGSRDAKPQDREESLNQSILKKGSKSKPDSKKKVQFDPRTDMTASSEKKAKLRSPPPTPNKVETCEPRSLKKMQFSSGKKAYKEIFLSNLHAQVGPEELDLGLPQHKNVKLDNFESVERLAEEKGVTKEEMETAREVDLAQQKKAALETLKRPVDLQPFQKMFQGLFKKKTEGDESGDESSRILKKIDTLRRLKGKQFQDICLDKIKYLMFLRYPPSKR